MILNNTIIVVEGTSDQHFLESFIQAEIVSTNGSSIPRGIIDYLKTQSAQKKIIVLTDPDGPGERIRSFLNEQIPELINVIIPKSQAQKNGKIGIAESDPEAIKEALINYQICSSSTPGLLQIIDLYNLGLLGASASRTRRERLSDRLHLGTPNAKTLLKRLNSLGISLAQLQEIMHEIS